MADLEVNIDRELYGRLRLLLIDLMTEGVATHHSDAEATSISAPPPPPLTGNSYTHNKISRASFNVDILAADGVDVYIC